MSVQTFKPWTDVVKLHPDVESNALTEAMFAIDLGAVAANDPNTPACYREAEAFFRATYLTSDMGKLLEEVLASLAGKPGFNRVLKMRTHFGGGKSHMLAALLHAAKSRKALNTVPEAKGFADPGKADVAVFDGEKFDARVGKSLDDGRIIRTMWGWIALQFGEDKYKLVEQHDRDLVSPGGDVIKKVLEGRPKLILLDEVLKYMERSAAVALHDSTLQRQAMDFIHNLTVEVSNTKNAVMVYSLQWSAREAMGNIALLQQIDKLTARVDQMREPVAGDEVLWVLKKRLLGAMPPDDAAQAVAAAYSEVVTGMWRAHAETPAARTDADEKGLEFQSRLKQAYPFHPALIDLMKDRWSSVDDYQRTRGALRFLALCLHTLKREGGARPILGPAELPLWDAEVRRSLLKDLDPKQDYYPVLTSDFFGANAKAKRIDERMAKESPALASVKPATRLATAILVYSFGGLRRNGEKGAETLPPGVTESELLSACVGPDLDSITASAVLAQLRTSCLYLHFDGVRYCFKKDPNVVKLIEDAEQEVARDPDQITERVKTMLNERLRGRPEPVVWPEKSADLPDKEPHFLIGYLPLEFAVKSVAEQEAAAKDMLFNYGDTPRRYRNGIAVAVPDKKQLEPLRRAVRYLLAIEKVEKNKAQHRLTKDQLQQLKERRQTEAGAAEGALRHLYSEVWLPRMDQGAEDIKKVEKKGRALQATGVHEQIMEVLTSLGRKWVHTSVTPQKVVERVKLGESAQPDQSPRLGVKTSEVVEAFFCFLEPPRLISSSVLQKAVARGVDEGIFAYTSGTPPEVGADGKFLVSWEKVSLNRQMAEDEVDLETGFLMTPSAAPAPPEPAACPKCGKYPCECTTPPGVCSRCGKDPCECTTPSVCPKCGQSPCTCPGGPTTVRLAFRATRDQIFKTFPAVANLADKSDDGKVTIEVVGNSESGFDAAWLRNAVEEPLDEGDVERL